MNERSHCPYLGLRQNRAIRFATPTPEHRCYVNGEAQEIPVDQRAYCLSINHLSCPLYTGQWSPTTAAAAGTGALAIPRRASGAGWRGREPMFYFALAAMAGLILLTLIWVGIYAAYSNSELAATEPGGDPTPPFASATPTTAPPTNTPIGSPDAPSGLTASASARGVLLNWNDNRARNLAGYYVYRGAAQDGPFVRLTDLLRASRYNDTTAPAGTTVYYRVIALDRAGRESTPATISVRTPAAPTATNEPTVTPTEPPTPEPTPEPTLEPAPYEPPVYVPPQPTIIYVPVPVTATPPPPTDTPEPTPEPTDTPAPEPTPANTPIPANTPAPEPTPEPTPEPITETPPTVTSATAEPTLVIGAPPSPAPTDAPPEAPTDDTATP